MVKFLLGMGAGLFLVLLLLLGVVASCTVNEATYSDLRDYYGSS